MSLQNHQDTFSNVRPRAPRNEEDLFQFLQAINEHAHDVGGWNFNPAQETIEPIIGSAVREDIPRIHLVAKKGRGVTLRLQLEQLLVSMHGGFGVTHANAVALWDYMDPVSGYQ